MNKIKDLPVIWIQGATCSGCSVSVLNSVRPEIHTVLLTEMIPGFHLKLRFQVTIMAGQGEQVYSIIEDKNIKEDFILVVEGAVPLREKTCMLGEKDGKDISFASHVYELALKATGVIALGTCASFGGIFSSHPNPTKCTCVKDFLVSNNINKPLINIPGCPPHPDWFLGTIAYIILHGIEDLSFLDTLKRPKMFYNKLIHENCPRRAYFDAGRFAKIPGEPYCLYLIGCKGPQTHADCPTRKWNNGINWCIENNHPCIGCSEPEFPELSSPFYRNIYEDEIPCLRINNSGKLDVTNAKTGIMKQMCD